MLGQKFFLDPPKKSTACRTTALKETYDLCPGLLPPGPPAIHLQFYPSVSVWCGTEGGGVDAHRKRHLNQDYLAPGNKREGAYGCCLDLIASQNTSKIAKLRRTQQGTPLTESTGVAPLVAGQLPAVVVSLRLRRRHRAPKDWRRPLPSTPLLPFSILAIRHLQPVDISGSACLPPSPTSSRSISSAAPPPSARRGSKYCSIAPATSPPPPLPSQVGSDGAD